ncbi:hypothetical protein D3C81_242150 [compost metagenome]
MDQLKRFAFKFIAITGGYAEPGREGLGYFFLGAGVFGFSNTILGTGSAVGGAVTWDAGEGIPKSAWRISFSVGSGIMQFLRGSCPLPNAFY